MGKFWHLSPLAVKPWTQQAGSTEMTGILSITPRPFNRPAYASYAPLRCRFFAAKGQAAFRLLSAGQRILPLPPERREPVALQPPTWPETKEKRVEYRHALMRSPRRSTGFLWHFQTNARNRKSSLGKASKVGSSVRLRPRLAVAKGAGPTLNQEKVHGSLPHFCLGQGRKEKLRVLDVILAQLGGQLRPIEHQSGGFGPFTFPFRPITPHATPWPSPSSTRAPVAMRKSPASQSGCESDYSPCRQSPVSRAASSLPPPADDST